VVTDMFCLLRLQAELAIQVKGLLMMRKGGFSPPPPPDIQERLGEIKYLERNIGRAGRLALMPLLPGHRRDAWQRYLAQQG